MQLKLLNLNCWEFAFFDKIVEFTKEVNPDLITLQEASTDYILHENEDLELTSKEDLIALFAKELNLQYIFAPSWGVISDNGKIKEKGVVIFYKKNLNLIDYHFKRFSNYLEFPSLTKENEDPLLKANTKFDRYLHSWKKPLNYLYSIFEIEGKLIKVITTQLTISYFCSESFQRVQQAQELADLVTNSSNTPTILCGDFNIEANSHTMQILQNSGLNILTSHLKNTLDTKIHAIFDLTKVMEGTKHSGYAVDHILFKGINLVKLDAPDDTAISDHIPLIVDFEV